METQWIEKLPVATKPERTDLPEWADEERGSMMAAGYVVISAMLTGGALLIGGVLALFRIFG